MNARMPCLAESSLAPVIDPVRSSTIMTSSGTAPHGEQAWAWTVSGMLSIPISRRKVVGTLASSVTCTVFAGLQNLRLVEQSAVAVVVTVPAPTIGFLPSSAEL